MNGCEVLCWQARDWLDAFVAANGYAPKKLYLPRRYYNAICAVAGAWNLPGYVPLIMGVPVYEQ